MAKKRALIVDDSKSARVVLGRMLQKYDIEVDTAESAETAIEYLKHNRPDVIFMDHLMPGMDGFQALQAIKNNPDTATIPIMMYTSQQGELYVGQARALGAVGVLPKLVKPVDVSKMLYQLHLLSDRTDLAPPVFAQANPAAASASAPADTQVLTGLVPADWHPQLEAALRNHDAELRRFILANLDTFSERLGMRMHEDVRAVVAQASAVVTPRRPRLLYATLAALALALLPGAVLGVFYLRTLERNHELSGALVRLEEREKLLSAHLERLEQRAATQTRLLAAFTPETFRTPGESPNDFTERMLPVSADVTIEPVPYGEVPLALARVDTLRELLAQLRGQSFRGELRVEAFRGEFCLQGSVAEGYTLAPPNLPAAECDLIGNPHQSALSPAQHESLAFANLASSVREREEGLTVRVILEGERLAVPYPSRETATAGRWNEVAARNNRVEFRALPAS